jgi:cytochrome b561
MDDPETIARDSNRGQYSRTAIALHWLTALLLVGSFTVGLSMVGLPVSRQKLQWYAWHKWIGITVFLVTCLRLAWRVTHAGPDPLETMPPWQRRASVLVHDTLYLLLLVIPLSGWIYSSSTGVQVVYLGLVPLPDLVPKDRELARVLLILHLTLNFALFSLVCVHSAQTPFHRPRLRSDAYAPAVAVGDPGERSTHMRLRSFIPSLGMMLLAAGQAGAEGVLIDKSEIRFVSKQMGINVEGSFRRWKANIVFLPGDLAHSKADFDIELASIDLASDEAESEARRASWFDTAKFPVAHFVSSSIKDVGGGKYEVAGKLSVKGVTRDAVVPIVLTKDASGNSVAEGSFTIKRLDYRIGDADWADPDTVANEVVVRVRMVLPPVR